MITPKECKILDRFHYVNVFMGRFYNACMK